MWEVMGGVQGPRAVPADFWGLACVSGWLVVPCTDIRHLGRDPCGRPGGGFGWYRLLVHLWLWLNILASSQSYPDLPKTDTWQTELQCQFTPQELEGARSSFHFSEGVHSAHTESEVRVELLRVLRLRWGRLGGDGPGPHSAAGCPPRPAGPAPVRSRSSGG